MRACPFRGGTTCLPCRPLLGGPRWLNGRCEAASAISRHAEDVSADLAPAPLHAEAHPHIAQDVTMTGRHWRSGSLADERFVAQSSTGRQGMHSSSRAGPASAGRAAHLTCSWSPEPRPEAISRWPASTAGGGLGAQPRVRYPRVEAVSENRHCPTRPSARPERRSLSNGAGGHPIDADRPHPTSCGSLRPMSGLDGFSETPGRRASAPPGGQGVEQGVEDGRDQQGQQEREHLAADDHLGHAGPGRRRRGPGPGRSGPSPRRASPSSSGSAAAGCGWPPGSPRRGACPAARSSLV